MPPARVSIQPQDFDLSREVEALRGVDARAGAVVAFVGTVRETADGVPLSALELEHYPGMTEHAVDAMVDEAQARFGILGARVIHRVGRLALQDQIMMIAVTAAHRGAAFQACEFLMDYLKTRAPFWKKELYADGTTRWVEARGDDDAALRRWDVRTGDNAASSRRAPP